MPVCIVGMHRSGTSLIARLLSQCGLYLGHESDLAPPGPDNPEGFFENRLFVRLDEDVLNALGGEWDSPPQLTSRWPSRAALSPVRKKAALLLEDFEGREPWGWKDPRASLLLPLWRQLVPDLKVVVCLRNPLEVAVSLAHRNHTSYASGLKLWASYYEQLLRDTRPRDRLVTHYDAYFHRPEAELDRLLDFTGISVDRAMVEGACDLALQRLRRSHFTAQDLIHAEASAPLIDLYVELCQEAGWGDGSKIQPGTRRRKAAGRKAADSSAFRINKAVVDAKQLARIVQGLEFLLAKRESTAAAEPIREQTTEERDQAIVDLRLEIEQLRAQVESPASELTIEELRAELREQLAERAQAASGQRERDARLEELELQVQALRAEVDRHTAEAERAASVAEAREAEIRDLKASAESMRLELDRRVADLTHAEPAAGADPVEAKRLQDYVEMKDRLRQAVEEHVPLEAIVAVVSKGDRELLELGGCVSWHFPRTENGEYAGFYPRNDTAAIAQLEVVRALGADFVVFPATGQWWLDHYPGFRRHLELRYRAVFDNGNTGRIFALRERPLGEAGAWLEVEAALAECDRRSDRLAAILDLNTGRPLAELFSDRVFTPPSAEPILPYIDRSADVVAVLEDDPERLAEAQRVARHAVLVFPSAGINGKAPAAPAIQWVSSGAEGAVPSTSIIIPCHNQLACTEACLETLFETLPVGIDAEVIVVDDASTDRTELRVRELAEREQRVRLIRNREQEGFLHACNRGAEAARGEILVFLNNDTVLLPGWLEHLLSIFRDQPDAGAAGGKLLFVDGTLQEAGGMLFEDGSAANFGRGDPDIDDPIYNFVREVDYCSGALLATRRDLFEQLGGFDPRYAPAYNEDSDYCFALRRAGYRVYYQPACTIVHIEGVSSGRDLTAGVKQYQVVNKQKFVAKWFEELRQQPPRPAEDDSDAWRALALQASVPAEAVR